VSSHTVRVHAGKSLNSASRFWTRADCTASNGSNRQGLSSSDATFPVRQTSRIWIDSISSIQIDST